MKIPFEKTAIVALLLFGINLPLFLIKDLVFDGLNPIVTLFTFSINVLSLRLLIKKQFADQDIVTIRHTVRYAIRLALLYSIWTCLYDYCMLNYWNPDILELQKKTILGQENIAKMYSAEEWNQIFNSQKNIFQLLFSALLSHSFLFSIIGLIFGYIFKTTSSK